MFNLPPSRNRYSQIFIVVILSSFIYVMARSASLGVASFEDNFFKKDLLIEVVARLRMKVGDRVFSQALIGKDGWIEYTGANNIDDFQNAESLENVEIIGKGLINLNTYLESQGITLLVVIAPNKASIYPDKLPEEIESLPVQSRLDSLISYMAENKQPPIVLDLRPALREARQGEDVYYKTDTHWNGYGSFVAYTTIIDSLKSSNPELKPYDVADMKRVFFEPAVRDIPGLIHAEYITEASFFLKPRKPFVETVYLEENLGYNQFSWIQDSRLPTLLMFHDSFGAARLNDYLSMNFGKSHYIHYVSMPKYLTQENIQFFKPDVIIIEIVERHLQLIPKYLPDFVLE